MRLSAGGSGIAPAASIRAVRNASIGLPASIERRDTPGTSDRLTGWKDQNPFASARLIPPSRTGPPSRGSNAPRFTHSTRAAISRSGSFPPGGICRSSSL